MLAVQTYSCSLDHDLNSAERYNADYFSCTDVLMNSMELTEGCFVCECACML